MTGWLVRLLGWPLATGTTRAGANAADAIVVLGAPLWPDGSLTPVGDERVRAGVALWRANVAPVVCMTGGFSRCRDVPEADAMAAAARELGVPDEALVVENASRNTKENAGKLADIVRPRGIRRVVLVTQPFHLRRARLWFRRAGFEPVGWRIEDSLQFSEPSRGLKWVMREYPALLRDWLR